MDNRKPETAEHGDYEAAIDDAQQRIARAEAQHRESVTLRRRLSSNRHRNRPCPCGSGRKFKKCCQGQYR